MTTDVALLFFYLLLALGVSFACSIFEAVLLSITPGYVAALEKEGAKTARRIKNLKANIDKPLAAILSLNTIAHTVGAAGVGAQSAIVFKDVHVGVISGVLTVLILFISEIIPKSLGAAKWKRLAPVVAALLIPVTFLMTITLLVPIARLITRWLGGTHGHMPTGDEISAIAEQGAHQGLFPAGESRILKNLFRLKEVKVSDIMTPRTVLLALDEVMPVGEVLDREAFPFSRIPLYRESVDDIVGYVLKSDILLKAARDELDVQLAELRRDLVAIDQDLVLSDLFERLLESQAHIALVVDPYGGTAGIVTMEDLVETLMGIEIVDEADAVTDMRELARKQWEKRARRTGIQVLPAGAADPQPPDAGESGA
jgi:CBS domain containing-hemolysin-like protein